MNNDGIISALGRRADPPVGGYVISSQGDGSRGTFGLLVAVEDRTKSYWCFLTAYHVVKTSSGICAMSQPDTDKQNIITRYDKNYPVCHAANGAYLIFYDTRLDVAACAVQLGGRKWGASAIYSSTGPKQLTTVRLPAIYTTVYKVGKTTGVTSGSVLGASEGRYVVSGEFGDYGDSGAPVYGEGGIWYGIVTSGGQNTEYGVFTDSNSILIAMRKKGLTLRLMPA